MDNIAQLGGRERCPHLGLHDDPGTSLAYPAIWNYCYRATPPASIQISHQVEVCLCHVHDQCLVYRSKNPGPLPASLQGKPTPFPRRLTARRGFIPLLLMILLAVPVLVVVSPLGGLSPPDVPLRNVASSPSRMMRITPTPSIVPAGIAGLISIITETPLSFQRTLTDLPLQKASVSATPILRATEMLNITPNAPGVCGYPLDTPFGNKVKFVVHRIALGESLMLYSRQYETMPDAILELNHNLHTPVWEGWVLVIPIDQMYVGDMPKFEPYQAIGTRLSVEELASQLDTDARALMEYNAFQGPCKVFSGWLLVPRSEVRN